MEMKINNTNLQVYSQGTVQRPQPQAPADSQAAQANQFAQARFADLLSMQEKKFIAQNFKAESVPRTPDSHLGKVVDIRA